MAPARKAKYDDSDDDEPRRPTKGKAGRKVHVTLSTPVWKGRSYRAQAQSLDASVVDSVFCKYLRSYPRPLKYRLLNLILDDPDKADNSVAKLCGEDFEDLRTDLKTKLADLTFVETLPKNAIVLAAYLGASVPDPTIPDKSVTDATLMVESASLSTIPPETRQVAALCAITMAKSLKADSGAVRCFCGSTAAFRTKAGWSGAPPTHYFACADGRCRMQISSDAVDALSHLMADMHVDKIPMWYCPTHPDRAIAISEEKIKDSDRCRLKARCTFYAKDADQKYCVAEYLGPDGEAFNTTGEQFWKAMDALTKG